MQKNYKNVSMVNLEDGQNLNPFGGAISCDKEFGPKNLRIAAAIDNVAKDFYRLAALVSWDEPRLEHTRSLFRKFSLFEAERHLKPWHEYHDLKMPDDLSDFAAVAEAFENFIRSEQGIKFFGNLENMEEALDNTQKLIHDLREMHKMVYEENNDFFFDNAINCLKHEDIPEDFDALCLCFSEFQARAMCMNVDWSMLTACLRYNIENAED